MARCATVDWKFTGGNDFMPASLQKKMRRPEWLAAIFITLAIVWLHFYFLFHAGGFCGDEVNVINLAGGHSLAFMARDSFPILLPLLIHGWTAMGLANSDLNLRLLGILIGLGLVGSLWLAALTARRAPPLISLTLLGLNGTAIFWEDYLRAYGLGSLLIVLVVSAMCFLLEKPTWWRTGILSVAAALSVQALYQNAVFFAGIGLGGWMVCLMRKDKGAALKIFAAGLTTAISLLPYWGCVSKWRQATAVIRPGFSFMAASDNFRTMAAFPLPQYVWVWKLLGLAVVALGIAVFFRPSRQPSRSDNHLTPAELQVFAGATLLAAVAGYFIFLRFAALITSPWYFLPLMALGGVCFDISVPLTTLPRMFRAVAWGILIATAGVAMPFAARDLNCRFTNVDLIAKRLMKEISPQDYVVVTPWYLGISFNRYYQGAAEWDTLPPVADHSTYRFDLAQAAAENSHASQPVLDHIASALQSGHRVWIVGLMSIPPLGRRAATEAGQFIAEHSQSFEQLDLKIKEPINDYEEESLLRASGWRTNQP
jgi:hypothetical protein